MLLEALDAEEFAADRSSVSGGKTAFGDLNARRIEFFKNCLSI